MLKSLSDKFEEGTGDYEARVYDVLAEIEKALRLDPDFPVALAFKVQLIADELGAHEEALEEASHLVQVAPTFLSIKPCTLLFKLICRAAETKTEDRSSNGIAVIPSAARCEQLISTARQHLIVDEGT